MRGDHTFDLGHVELGTFALPGEMSRKGWPENCRGEVWARNGPLTGKEGLLITRGASDCDDSGGNRPNCTDGGVVWRKCVVWRGCVF